MEKQTPGDKTELDLINALENAFIGTEVLGKREAIVRRCINHGFSFDEIKGLMIASKKIVQSQKFGKTVLLQGVYDEIVSE